MMTVGYIIEGKGEIERREIHSTVLWQVPMPVKGWLAPWYRKRQWKRLQRLGIRRAVFPVLLREEAEKWGVRPVEVWPLRRAVQGQLLARFDGTTAALRAQYTELAVEETAMLLARRFRYLELDAGRGTKQLAERLWKKYGLCIGGTGGADVTVSFGGAPRQEQEICLGEDCAQWQEVTYKLVDEEEEWEEGILAVLFQNGEIQRDEIRVKSITTKA